MKIYSSSDFDVESFKPKRVEKNRLKSLRKKVHRSDETIDRKKHKYERFRLKSLLGEV